MNYLAHAYLSFGNEQVLLGNMISDFIKGKQQFHYPPVIHKGILLHRAIDTFTDTHPTTQKAKSVFKNDYRLYSGAFVDVAYDHFLARDKNTFPQTEDLFHFSQETYRLLQHQKTFMPPRFEQMFFYMQSQNWLFEYRTHQGISQSFTGLVKRAAYLQSSAPAIKVFERHYAFLQTCFEEFWQELKPFTINKMEQLLNDPNI